MTDQEIDAAVARHLGSMPGTIVNPGMSRALRAILRDVVGPLERRIAVLERQVNRVDARSTQIAGQRSSYTVPKAEQRGGFGGIT